MQPGDLVEPVTGFCCTLVWTTATIDNITIGSREERFFVPTEMVWNNGIRVGGVTLHIVLIDFYSPLLILSIDEDSVQALDANGEIFEWSKRFSTPWDDNLEPYGKFDDYWATGVKNVY